nr:guanylate kinase [Enterocloster clostridioformis]
MNKNIQISTLKSQGEHTMNQQGILVVVSGFSGAGKGTLMKELLKRYDNYALSVSATTRQPREGEKDGEDYFFVSREYFQQMIEDGRLVEYAQYVNHYYGTPRDYVEKKMAEGKDVILEIEIQGALKVKKRFPDALLIFVTPPSAGELRRRLVGRGTETIEVINARLRRAAEEASGMEAYDYLLINDEIDACVEQMHQLITLQHSKTCYHLDFLSRMREELYHLDDRQ